MMYEYLAEQYEQYMRPPPRPLVHWLLLAVTVAGLVAMVATLTAHVAHRVALETANPGHCFSTGC